MSDASVLKRKLVPPLAKALADCALETLLRKTMPRDADRLCGLDLVVDDVAFCELDKGALIQALSDSDLVYQLADEKGAGGLCVVSPELLAGLIEIQLYGYVASGDVGERRPTRTDGIVAGVLLDAWLASAQSVAALEKMEPLPFSGFTRQPAVLDQRNASLLIEPGAYTKLTIQMTLGDNAKSGRLCLAWPRHVPAPSLRDESFSVRMHRHLAGLNVHLKVVLARQSVPMEQVCNLAVDDVIDIPIAALASVRLEGVDGTPIATGRLGQMNGLRAVRLNIETPNRPPAVSAPLLAFKGAPPDMSKIARMPEMTKDLSGAPGASGTGDLPDLPDLPEMSDLPDLPDLPEIPDLP